MSALAELVEEAHHTAIHQDPAELTSELQDLLGQKLVAYVVGDRHPKSIGRYARGERLPDPAALGALVTARTVVGILRHGMSDQAIKAWMMGANPRLRGIAPIVALHEGRGDEVLGAAQAFVARR